MSKLPKFMLTLTCDECQAEIVPQDVSVGPIGPDLKDPQGRMLMVVHFSARCPVCGAVGDMLRRAGLHSLARDMERR